MYRVMAAVMLLLIIAVVPTPADALSVTIAGTTLTTTTMINGQLAIAIAGTYTQGGSTFVISTCSTAEGCSGLPARVFVNNGPTIDSIVLTDAKIAVTAAGTAPIMLAVSFSSSDFSPALVSGTYPYAIAMNGLFLGLTAKNDVINVTGTANGATIGTLVAPPFSSSITASFTKQAMLNISCPNIDPGVESLTTAATSLTCIPSLTGSTTLTFTPGTLVRLPGSIHVLGPTLPLDQGGLQILADALAALLPASKAKALRADLEPSPGSPSSLFVRGMNNSGDPWVVDREGNGESKTRVEITVEGVVKVDADGLCDAVLGCMPTSVDVSLFCAETGSAPFTFSDALVLDANGNGNVTIPTLPSLPCTDPAVLITQGSTWIAAPGVP